MTIKKLPPILRLLILLTAVFAPVKISYGERLPIRAYTSADGLASSAVNQITRDSRGFLWFATRDGLSRFDGREFINYRLKNELSAQVLFQILVSSKDIYWIIAYDGLYRIERTKTSTAEALSEAKYVDNRQMLNAVKVSDVTMTAIYEDRKGNLWGGNNQGLFLIEDRGEREVILQPVNLGVNLSPAWSSITAISEGNDGSLWIGNPERVFRRLPDGRVYQYPVPKLSNRDNVNGLVFDDRDNLWISHSAGLFILRPHETNDLANFENFSLIQTSLKEQTLESKDFLTLSPGQMVKMNFESSLSETDLRSAQNGISCIYKSLDGKIWFMTQKSLFAYSGDKFQRLTDNNSLAAVALTISEDLAGNIWLGTTGGAFRLTRQGLTTFNQEDGLRAPNVSAIHQSADGDLWIAHDNFAVSRFIGKKFERRQLSMPPDSRIIWASPGAFLDNSGAWWALAENGLYHFKDDQLLKKYSKTDGLKSNSFFCAFQDRAGNLWFSTRRTQDENGLIKIDSQNGSIHTFSEAEGFPPNKSATSFVEDSAGNLWIGFYESGLVRYRNNRFEVFSAEEGIPKTGSIPSMHIDRRGRLWIASGGEGLLLVENPLDEKPVFKRLSTADGLSSNGVRRIIEDQQGNIYLGTTRGIDRLNTETRQIKHYTTADGLASDYITAAFTDKNGALWFGTQFGLSRLDPVEDITQTAPKVFINALQIAGVRYGISEFGQETISDINVASSENNIQVNFVSVGDSSRYQYKLEGAAEEAWSELVAERTVNYANLSAGSYKFLVRAVNSAGIVSDAPATVSFKIHPPFWRTWYFLTGLLLITGIAVFSLDRYRVAKTRQVKSALEDVRRSKEERLRELEKVRTRIANDLHDDIGASLTQITILSEVARSQAVSQPDKDSTQLERISEISNELVETMSDIVWAINPRKDQLRDLIKRMRRFAADILSARQIKFEFNTPALEDDFEIGANLRREIFAIFKETINNSVKHSKCTRVEASFEVRNDFLKLSVSDNGKGFDMERLIHESYASGLGGNGLNNIQRRGAELSGKCEIISFEGGGTTILVEIPLTNEEK